MRIFLLLLAIALTGAPFGMGRMMDGAHHAMAMMDHDNVGHMHHEKAPAHEPSSPHFMMCAACFATHVGSGLPLEPVELRETALALPSAVLHGKSLLPDLPPPRI